MASLHRIKRRDFLKGTLLAGLAAGFPALVPSSVLGANAPSRRITLGFIGMGMQAGGYLLGQFMRRDDVQVLAVCDVESKRREACKARVDKQYGDAAASGTSRGCTIYSDFRELLARPDIDAVVIATPDHWHALMVIEACRQGKDVYCEKPLSLTIQEAKLMVEAARRHGRVVQTGSMQRSDARFRLACEMVRSGRIGDVHSVYVNVGATSDPCFLPAEPVFDTLDWNSWLGPAPLRPYNAILCPDHTRTYPDWRLYRDYSGGMMTDWGAHHFDIAQWGLGMDESGPVEIVPPDGKDVQYLTYRYSNGVKMYHTGKFKKIGVEFIGARGRVMVNRGYLETAPGDILKEPLRPDEVHLHNSNDHQADWLECIRSRRKPICDVAIGARSATVCHLGNIAYWTKRPVRWDPVKQCITGDEMQSVLMTRSYREPWIL